MLPFPLGIPSRRRTVVMMNATHHRIDWRLMYASSTRSILSILLIGLNVPYTYPNLDEKETRTSPFTIVFEMTGARAAGSVINAVVMTSVLSAGNHALFAGARLLYTLAIEGHAPRVFANLSRNQVPWVAVLATGLSAGLCFGSSFIGAGQLWSWLQKCVLQSLSAHGDNG